jgi:exopolyphosphatase / guanosine-5'-triphosphate,3'-diphosphate pyrophosphatase
MRFAAIDVGSNAVRLLISNVFEIGEWKPFVRKANLYRAPVRLGEDAFLRNEISKEVADDFVKAMAAFKNLMDVCHVDDYVACATSAMRSAQNGKAIVDRVRHETGIKLEIIDGSKEAEYIALNRLDGRFMDGNYLYIDVGGGSTELSLFEDGALKAARSFQIGTIRMKESLVSGEAWNDMQQWVEGQSRGVKKLNAIGSGGNINKLFKLCHLRQDRPLSIKKLKKRHKTLSRLSLEERMVTLGLRPDRADVIVPAGRIYISVMEQANISEVYVPQIGLADGLIHSLYQKYKGMSRLKIAC